MNLEDTQEEKHEELKVDLLSEGISNHPLYQSVIRIAAQNNIDLTNVGSVATVLEKLDNSDVADPRSLLLLSLILERLVEHNEYLAIRELMSEGPDPSEEETLKNTD